jgi:hypothetical protein
MMTTFGFTTASTVSPATEAVCRLNARVTQAEPATMTDTLLFCRTFAKKTACDFRTSA